MPSIMRTNSIVRLHALYFPLKLASLFTFSLLLKTSGSIWIVATYRNVPADSKRSTPTHKPRSFFDESSSFVSYSKWKDTMANSGEVSVNESICNRITLACSFIWVKKVPKPRVAGILCIKMAKKMTMPRLEAEDDSSSSWVWAASVVSELTKGIKMGWWIHKMSTNTYNKYCNQVQRHRLWSERRDPR